MKGILFVVLLLAAAALNVGILVVTDLTTEDESGFSNVARMDRARETADTDEKALRNVRDVIGVSLFIGTEGRGK